MKLTESRLRSIIREELQNIQSGSGYPSTRGSVGDLSKQALNFLEKVARDAYAGMLGYDIGSGNAGVTQSGAAQVELTDRSADASLRHLTFLTLIKTGENEYKLSADADTRSPGGMEAESSSYLTFETNGQLSPQDVNRDLAGRVADMIEDAEMDGHKYASDLGRTRGY